MTESEILRVLSKVLFLPKDTILKQIGERFFSSLGYPNYMWRNEHVIRMMIRQSKRIMKVTGCCNKEVLEIGCGMGFHSMIMALSDVSKVTALDQNENHVSILRNMIKAINHLDLNHKMEVICGDAINLGLQSSKYDVIQALDVLSHCQDLDRLISEVKRVGKPESILYILDGNNGLRFGHTKEIIRLQYLAEHGPLEKANREGRCSGFESTYLNTRKEIIRKYFTALDVRTINDLAKRTAGMYGPQIIRFAEKFLSGKNVTQEEIPYPDVYTVKPFYRNPVNGMWPDIAFSPYKLKNYLNNKGIYMRLIPYKHAVVSGGLKGFVKRQISILVRLLYPASIFIAPGFELLGRIKSKM